MTESDTIYVYNYLYIYISSRNRIMDSGINITLEVGDRGRASIYLSSLMHYNYNIIIYNTTFLHLVRFGFDFTNISAFSSIFF